jgi:signal transduction histidine kinase
MRSAERAPTLARRLTLTLVLVSGLAATLAASAALLLADAIIGARLERSVEAAAALLAVEVDELPVLVHEGLGAEAVEIGIEGRVAIVSDEHGIIAGDPSLRAPDRACAVLELDAGGREFICRHELEHDPSLSTLVAIPAARLHDHRPPLLIAGLSVIAIVVLGSIVVGVVLSRRLLAPLEHLRRAVDEIDVVAPGAVTLPNNSRFEELLALREALAKLLAGLEGELERTRRFSSAAAHELRTPLAKIRAELELALEQPQDGASVRATFERLVRTTDHLVTLSERLLTLATPHRALSSTRGASLAQVAEALLERRGPVDAERLTILTGAADGLVRGDEILLAAMLDNIVDNALKFSTGSVQVRVFEEGDDVVVEVADSGPGIPDELASSMFEPFRRGNSHAEPGSTFGFGLGLALVAHIAKAYGGQAAFVSGQPRGATLVVRLPRVRTTS